MKLVPPKQRARPPDWRLAPLLAAQQAQPREVRLARRRVLEEPQAPVQQHSPVHLRVLPPEALRSDLPALAFALPGRPTSIP